MHVMHHPRRARADSRFYICKISCHGFFLEIAHGVRTMHRITRRRWISSWSIYALWMHRAPAPKQAIAITMGSQTFIKFKNLQVFLTDFWRTHFDKGCDSQIANGNQYPEEHFMIRLQATCNPTICDPILVYLDYGSGRSSRKRWCMAGFVFVVNTLLASLCLHRSFLNKYGFRPGWDSARVTRTIFALGWNPRDLYLGKDRGEKKTGIRERSVASHGRNL